jgi:hypothetical protein
MKLCKFVPYSLPDGLMGRANITSEDLSASGFRTGMLEVELCIRSNVFL